MSYTIVDRNGKVMETGTDECLPNQDILQHIKKAGYKIKTSAEKKTAPQRRKE